MKRTFLGLIIKFIGTFVVAWIAYDLIESDNRLLWIFLLALAVTLLSYLIGDLLILPRYGNVFSSLADVLLAVVVVWVFDLLTDDFRMGWLSTIVFAVLIFIMEFFLHKYLVHDEED